MVMEQEMYIYFRRIYFHNFISIASLFYRITKDLKNRLKIFNYTLFYLGGTDVVVKKLGGSMEV